MSHRQDLPPEALRYLPLVNNIAGNVFRKVSLERVTLDDLVETGIEALGAAVSQFRPRQGASFRAYAFYRIRGAILDHVQKMTMGLSLPDRAGVRFRQKANEWLLYYSNSAESVVKRTLEGEAIELKQLLQHLICIALLSFAEAAMQQESLQDSEQLLVRYYYQEDLSMEATARRLQVPPSSVFRLHQKLLEKLRSSLTNT